MVSFSQDELTGARDGRTQAPWGGTGRTDREGRAGEGVPMTTGYKRRRPSLVRNFWVYRRLVGLAMVLGLMLWFIWANNAKVTVFFPFGLGTYESRLGLIILLSALVGSA